MVGHLVIGLGQPSHMVDVGMVPCSLEECGESSDQFRQIWPIRVIKDVIADDNSSAKF